MDTVLDSKIVSELLLLNDESPAAALEMARNFREALGPDGVQIAEYRDEDSLILVFAEPFGFEKITGIRFETDDLEVIVEILEMFEFGPLEPTSGLLAGPQYFFHNKQSTETGDQ